MGGEIPAQEYDRASGQQFCHCQSQAVAADLVCTAASFSFQPNCSSKHGNLSTLLKE